MTITGIGITTTLNSIRACKAPREDGKNRCRNHATKTGYCSIHGGCTETAPAPQVVLFKAKINGKWINRFEEAGVPWQNCANDEVLQERHGQEAEELDRKPTAIRKNRNDGGTPVFGNDGAKFVSTVDAWNELLRAGHNVTDIHLRRQKDDDRMATIEVVMPIGSTPSQECAQGVAVFLKLIGQTAWEAAHVWANGKDRSGRITHTVNLCHRLPDTKPEASLAFANGLWDLV